MSKYQHYILWSGFIGVLILNIQTFAGSGLMGEASKEKIVICHVPSDPDVTMEIPASALNGHLHHGDYEGPCQISSSSTSSSEGSDTSSTSSATSSDSSSVSSENSSSSTSSSDISSFSSSSSTASSESSSSSDSSAPSELSVSPSTSNTSGNGGGGGGGGGDNSAVLAPIFRGHGLAEHASVVDFILSTYDLQPNSLYSFGGQGNNPQAIVSATTTDRMLREHAAACSMFRYFQQLEVVRPHTPDDYIDWMSTKIADALKEDPQQMKAALLGRPPVHMDTLLQGISDQGCAANAYVYVPPIEGTSLPTEAAPNLNTIHTDQSNPLHDAAPLTDLHIQDNSTDTDIAFSVLHGNDVFNDYGNSLTHEMHMIVIRDDLQYFYHTHPKRDQFGTWHIPFAPAVGGTYWIYTNFVDRAAHSYGLRFTRMYPGGSGTGETLDFSQEKVLDSYHFRLEPAVTDSGISFTYKITDDAGQPARLQKFMGAFGHQVIISTNGYFSHSHPSIRVNGDPVFFVNTPPAGMYVIFVAFDIQGKEYTLAFRWAH